MAAVAAVVGLLTDGFAVADCVLEAVCTHSEPEQGQLVAAEPAAVAAVAALEAAASAAEEQEAAAEAGLVWCEPSPFGVSLAVWPRSPDWKRRSSGAFQTDETQTLGSYTWSLRG